MAASGPLSHYALGNTDAEHQRLIRQAAWLAPHTERLLRHAGIGPGQRVLDLGSGVGDVALIAAQLVGPSGEVLGIERDPRSIERARARMADAGMSHVSFTQSDVSQIPSDQLFDAVVGRYILMFLPDPVAVLRSLVRLIRPGGVFAFQEPCWKSFFEQANRMPLWSAASSVFLEVLDRSGTKTEMGPALSQVFQQAGLPMPATRKDTLIGAEEWLPGCLLSMRPSIDQLKVSTQSLGDFQTLSDRLHAEVQAFHTNTALPGLISAWCRMPAISVACHK